MRTMAAWVGALASFGGFDGLGGLVPDSIPDPLVDLAAALIILAVGWYLSKLTVRVAGRTVAQRIQRPSVTRTVLRGIRITVLLFAVVIAAGRLGVGSPQILLSVGVISAVIAVVLAPLIGSLINGVFIISDRPFEIGDMIEVTDQGHRGFVEDITIRYTKIFTLENTLIVIPNSEIHTRDVINYSAEDERTRLSVQFDVTYESDLDAARRHAERGARSVDGVISGGPAIRIGSARYGAAPICDILEYSDHGVRLQVRFWVNRPYKQTIARSDVQAEIRRRFAANDVEFAYPHTHHVFDDTSGVARMAIDDGGDEPGRDRVRRPTLERDAESGDRSSSGERASGGPATKRSMGEEVTDGPNDEPGERPAGDGSGRTPTDDDSGSSNG